MLDRTMIMTVNYGRMLNITERHNKIVESLETDEVIEEEQAVLYRLYTGNVTCTIGSVIRKNYPWDKAHTYYKLYFRSDEEPNKSKSRISKKPEIVEQSALWLPYFDIEYARSLFIKYEEGKIKHEKRVIMERENVIMKLQLAGTK